MSLRTESCSYCKGTGTAEVLETLLAFDYGWKRTSRYQDRQEMEEAIAREPSRHRWVECKCPRCDGAGEYQVEYVTCKIF